MQPETQTLSTERLYLKEVTPELYRYLFEHSSEEEFKTFFDLDDALMEQAKERYKKGITYYGVTFKYFMVQDKETQKTIGTCGYYRWYPEHDRAEFGYVMSNTEFRQKGLMKEAAKRLIRFGFEDMGLHRIEAFASPDNIPSIKILEGFGMQYEGLMREHYLRNGVYEPSACYSILKHEYDANTAP